MNAPANRQLTEVKASPRNNIIDLLKKQESQIQAALPKHLSSERMMRLARTAISQNSSLEKCTPISVLSSVVVAAQMGLEIGVNGHGYLVPYYNYKTKETACQFIPGWKGLVDLANRSGNCSVWTGAVYEGDVFSYSLGTNPFIDHKPEGDSENLKYVYAVGYVKGASFPQIEVWSIEKVLRHREKNKNYQKLKKEGKAANHYSHENLEMYAKKLPLLQVLKYMPVSTELNKALEVESANEQGKQFTIDGDFVVLSDEQEPLDTAEELEDEQAH